MFGRVAVITRTKNRGMTLARCMRTLEQQTFKDFVWMIVNDGGDPKEVEYVLQQNSNVLSRTKVLHNEQSLGMEAASNIGIMASNSEYIVIFDDDDSWEPTFLEKCVAFLDEQGVKSSFQGVISYASKVFEQSDSDRIQLVSMRPFNHWIESVTLHRLCYTNVFPNHSFVYRRSVLENIGMYNEDLPVLGDWDFNLRFLCNYDIGLIKEDLVNYHQRIEFQSGSYANSNLDLHDKFAAVLQNRLLRQEIREGRVGVGVFMGVFNQLNDLLKPLFPTAHSTSVVPLTHRAVHLMDEDGVRECIVYGAGQAGQSLVRQARLLGIDVHCVVDSNESMWGREVEGIPIKSVSDASRDKACVWAIGSFEYAMEIMRNIVDHSSSLDERPAIYTPFGRFLEDEYLSDFIGRSPNGCQVL